MTEGIGGSKIFSDGWGSNNQKKSCIFHSPQLQFLKAISYQLSAISYQLSAISYQLSAITPPPRV